MKHMDPRSPSFTLSLEACSQCKSKTEFKQVTLISNFPLRVGFWYLLDSKGNVGHKSCSGRVCRRFTENFQETYLKDMPFDAPG